MIKKLHLSVLAAFTVGFIGVFIFPPPKDASAQVFGPTTRTPSLIVGPGNTTVQNLTINGTCTGCGSITTEDTLQAFNWTIGCNPDVPTTGKLYRVGKLVTLDVQAISCTSDGGFQFRSDFFTQRPDLIPDGIYFYPLAGATNNGVAGFAKLDVDDGSFFGWQFCAITTPQTCSINGWTSTAGQIRTSPRYTISWVIP